MGTAASSGTPQVIDTRVSRIFEYDRGWGFKYQFLRDPFEGDSCIHPSAVRVNRGGEITEVTNEGTKITQDEASGRGVRIELDFDQEDGICWTLAFQFHKGATFTSLLLRENNPDRWASTIWRD